MVRRDQLANGRVRRTPVANFDLPDTFKAKLLNGGFYMEILRHRNFNPRLVEWLSRFVNVRAIPANAYRKEVERVLENPEQLWRIAFEQQISEASRSLVLALYSLGGDAHLDQLEAAWRVLHAHRAKKYNWRTAAEDWRRSLEDLEGGFLQFKDRNATFVNPSVKDFLDATLTEDTEHLEDLVAAACLFSQIVCVWSLARSEKGNRLEQSFKQSPERLIGAIRNNLQKPHEEKITFEGGCTIREFDARPEVRLRTMISVADHTRSSAALRATAAYATTVTEFWSTHRPDFAAAGEILRTLDSAEWCLVGEPDIHDRLKGALLGAITPQTGSSDIYEMARYATGTNARWSPDDQTALVGCFVRYLGDEFYSEIVDCEGEDHLLSLSDAVESIGKACGIDVQRCLDHINERISELSPDGNDDDHEARQWEGSGQPTNERTQEAEVERLFDGLRSKPPATR
jgi:hypothetical protein